MNGSTVWDFLALAFVVLIIYVLVRPGSKAGEFVDAFFNLLGALIRSATDLGSKGVQ